eukprot:CAMPEP_0172800910 /NCGR_PEP_ID=MMETSP1075-20121228/2859_1 /TAXON_ID=2916 /ORGANISM="Ceratium fusus, Strain PA161109" /LENGTH=487 /DNA_ID=CAMNT_0013638877 /DNA_START=120 /DNA_END=1583 /DNA_ORIENTATION=-
MPPTPLIVPLPETTTRDGSSPSSASLEGNDKGASLMGSSWSKKMRKSVDDMPLGVRTVRTDDDALSYTAMTSANGSLRSPANQAENCEESLSVRQVSIAACGIIILVFFAICCGAWLGMQLGTHAMKRVSKSGESNDAHHHHPASKAHGEDADLIQANWSAASMPAAATAHVRGASAAQRQVLGHSSSPEILDSPDTFNETTSRPFAVIVMGNTSTSTNTTTSIASTSTQITSSTSTSTSRSSGSSSSTSTTMLSTTSHLPSLFCFSIMRCNSYELSLMRTQLAKGLGIFGCDAYSVFSENTTWLTPGPPVRIDSIALNISLQAKAGTKEHILNTQIFLKAWEQVKAGGLYIQHEWIVKVDPDAVFFPQRLRDHLVKITPEGSSLYFLNCRLSFGLFGALEIMSRVALQSFYDGLERCKQVLPWRSFGEDMFLRKCLDFLGVTPRSDFSLLSDGYCGEQPSPCISGKVAFHPFKNVETYLKCTHEAN